MNQHEITTKEDASERGLSRYFDGIPCVHGHVVWRYMNGRCSLCMKYSREKYAEKNPLTQRANNANIRATQKYKVHGLITPEIINNIIESQNHKCAYCEASFTYENMHIDHKTPMCKGGSNTEDNIHMTCEDCNRRKGILTHEEYMAQGTRDGAKRMVFYMPDRQSALLKEESSRLQMTMGELLRRIIDNHFDQKDKKK